MDSIKNKYRFDEETCKRVCILQLLLFIIFLAVIVWRISPYISGDGAEYMLQTESLYNHYSMDIRDVDVKSSVINFNTTRVEEIWNVMKGRFLTSDGRDFAAHFGGYAAFVLPFKLVLKLFGSNQFRCFQLANAIFYICALCVVLFKLKSTWKNKMFLLLLLICNPALYYITWTHTEIFSYSFTIIGLVYFYNKSYKLSALFISMAAMQNPALIFLGVIVGIDYLVNLINIQKKQDHNVKFLNLSINVVKSNFCDILLMLIAYIPFFLPLIHTYINFHKLNLVASVAMESEYTIEKALSYLFDLNVGILPYTPVILILFIISIIIGLRKIKYKTILNIFALFGILYVISHQIQINSGMSGIMRYNVWIIPIMIFYIVLNREVLYKSDKVNSLFSISAIITLFVIFVSGGILCSNFNSNQFSPWSKLIMNNIPSAYNPYHGIFISRTTNMEAYSTDKPIIYSDNNGFVRKILIKKGTQEQLKSILFNGTDEDIEYLNDKIKNLDLDKEYQYINIEKKYNIKASNVINLFRATDFINKQVNLPGFYQSEGEFCWIKPKASITISDEMIRGNNIKLCFMINELLKRYNANVSLKLDIYINGTLVNSVDLEKCDLNKDINIILENKNLPNSYKGTYTVDLVSNAFFNPKSNGINNSDERDLSIMLKYLGPEN